MRQLRAWWRRQDRMGRLVIATLVAVPGLFGLTLCCLVAIGVAQGIGDVASGAPTPAPRPAAVAPTAMPTPAPLVRRTPTPAPTRTPLPTVQPDAVRLTRAELGDAWPLTVDEATVTCVRGVWVVLFADGQIYAVNGLARGVAAERGWRDVAAIRADGPANPGLKRSLAPILEAGLALCRR
jgi:hypothetical protein